MARRSRGRSKSRKRTTRFESKSQSKSRIVKDVRVPVTLYQKKGMSTIAYLRSRDILSKAAELFQSSLDSGYARANAYWSGILDRSLGIKRSLRIADLPEQEDVKKSKKKDSNKIRHRSTSRENPKSSHLSERRDRRREKGRSSLASDPRKRTRQRIRRNPKQELTRSRVSAAADLSPFGEVDASESERDMSSAVHDASNAHPHTSEKVEYPPVVSEPEGPLDAKTYKVDRLPMK